MILLGRPLIEATRSVRVSLDVEIARKKVEGDRRHPVSMLLALVGDLQDEGEGDPVVLRGFYVQIAAVAQHAAGEIDREVERG